MLLIWSLFLLASTPWGCPAWGRRPNTTSAWEVRVRLHILWRPLVGNESKVHAMVLEPGGGAGTPI